MDCVSGVDKFIGPVPISSLALNWKTEGHHALPLFRFTLEGMKLVTLRSPYSDEGGAPHHHHPSNQSHEQCSAYQIWFTAPRLVELYFGSWLLTTPFFDRAGCLCRHIRSRISAICRLAIALCSYPHVKVSIRDLSQTFTTAPIFQKSHYFRQKYLEIASWAVSLLNNIWARVEHSLLQQLNSKVINCSSGSLQAGCE